MKGRMTKQEFELSYAQGSGVTLELLHANGMYAVPAEVDELCDYPDCEGWHMVHRVIWEDAVKWGMRDPKDLELLRP